MKRKGKHPCGVFFQLFRLHCYHRVAGSDREEKGRCKVGGVVVWTERCCRCGKERTKTWDTEIMGDA